MISRDGEHGPAEALQEVGRLVVLLGPPAVRQVSACDDQLGVDSCDQVGEARFELRVDVAPDVQIREVEETGSGPGHSRGRLYTQIVVDEPTEIFDDLYLGLRAGGALRKKRRGEPLTMEEEEALGRWESLSSVRKAATIGAFAIGTFSIGFTLGGLVFGRWRKA